MKTGYGKGIIRIVVLVAAILGILPFFGDAAVSAKEVKNEQLNLTELHLDVNTILYTSRGQMYKSKNESYPLKLLNSKGRAKSKVRWYSSNKKIATVTKGRVKPLKKGKCVITAKVGGNKYRCMVTVTNYKSKSKIASQTNTYTVLGLLNADRIKAGRKPVALSKKVKKAAKIRAVEQEKLFSHVRPNGKSFSSVYGDLGIDVRRKNRGENVGRYSDHAEYASEFAKNAYKAFLHQKSTEKLCCGKNIVSLE